MLPAGLKKKKELFLGQRIDFRLSVNQKSSLLRPNTCLLRASGHILSVVCLHVYRLPDVCIRHTLRIFA